MVAHVAVLSDERKELHVRARLDQIISSPLEEREISLESRDAVALTVEAATAQEGRGFFTSQNFRSSRWWTGWQWRCSATSQQTIRNNHE